jgi:hypothetical protein
VLLLLNGGSSNAFVDGTTTVNLNTWYYIAATCDGTGASANLRLWVNGNYEGGTTFNSSQVNTNAANTRVMAWPETPLFTAGYASNVRILKGIALYTGTGAITVPTTPLTAITNTSLLLNFTNAGIYDAAAQNNVITVGDAQVSTTITPKWPPSSMKFDGTGDYLTMPLTPATTITSGNFTIEFWLNPSTVSTSLQAVVGTREGDGSVDINWGIGLITNQLSFQAYNTSNGLIGTITHQTTLSAGTWYYCALTRNGSTFTLYINSVASTSTATSSSTIQQSGTTLRVGQFGAASIYSALNGYVQDVRITKGVARTITTPTLAFQTR